MCKSEELIERRKRLMKWLETIQEEIGDIECDDKEIRHILIDSHLSIVRRFQESIKDTNLELERIRVNEYEKERVKDHEPEENEEQTEN